MLVQVCSRRQPSPSQRSAAQRSTYHSTAGQGSDSQCSPPADMPLEERQSFLRELRHAYGRTGLVLSGGGSFGFWCAASRIRTVGGGRLRGGTTHSQTAVPAAGCCPWEGSPNLHLSQLCCSTCNLPPVRSWHLTCLPTHRACRHFGVVRALLEANLLPRVVSGSSAGSIGGRGWVGALEPAMCSCCCHIQTVHSGWRHPVACILVCPTQVARCSVRARTRSCANLSKPSTGLRDSTSS